MNTLIQERPVLEQLAEAVKWWNADEAEEPDVRRLFAACKAEIERLESAHQVALGQARYLMKSQEATHGKMRDAVENAAFFATRANALERLLDDAVALLEARHVSDKVPAMKAIKDGIAALNAPEGVDLGASSK